MGAALARGAPGDAAAIRDHRDPRSRRQAKLNRIVAIKVLPETFTRGEDELRFAKRFEQEARAMAKLDHPAILSVHDFGETAGGQLYFVMEFVDGMDIHQYLHHHGGKLPQEQALAIVAHVLDALDYAHGHGIVHPDQGERLETL